VKRKPVGGRILEHPILRFDRGKKVNVTFNGRKLDAYENDTVAVALYAAGIHIFSRSFKYHRPRGLYCAVGKCSSCFVRINGVPNVRACTTRVEDGMVIETQVGLPSSKHDIFSIMDWFDIPTNLHWRGFVDPFSWSVAQRGVKVLTGTTRVPDSTLRIGRLLPSESREVDVVVIGAGPAGISAALYASKLGAKVALVDENPVLGGQLVKQTHKFFGSVGHYAGKRGVEIARLLEDETQKSDNIEVLLNSTAIGVYGRSLVGVVQSRHFAEEKLVKLRAKRIVVCTGGYEKSLLFENNDLPGIMGAGGVQTLMNVYGVKPGNEAIIVGAGNVGLILAYQMIQAKVKVNAILEILPRVGGYFVHAAKAKRLGIPILTSHTIVKALGKKHVKGAIIAKFDERFRPVKGTERKIETDLIAIAVGFHPTCELAMYAGAKVKFIPELGGFVPLHDRYMETSVKGVYVAGDSSGIEEATSAILQGRIAGISVALSLGLGGKEDEELRERTLRELDEFRSNPFGEKVKVGKRKALVKRR
jgi:sarcosine oxidase subunit alpha